MIYLTVPAMDLFPNMVTVTSAKGLDSNIFLGVGRQRGVQHPPRKQWSAETPSEYTRSSFEEREENIPIQFLCDFSLKKEVGLTGI